MLIALKEGNALNFDMCSVTSLLLKIYELHSQFAHIYRKKQTAMFKNLE